MRVIRQRTKTINLNKQKDPEGLKWIIGFDSNEIIIKLQINFILKIDYNNF